MANATADLWYQYFHKDGTVQSQVLLAVYGLRALWATVGILFNVTIVHITWNSKSLHGVCNILIALESFCAIFQDASYYVSFLIFLSGIKFISYQNCFPTIIVESTFGNCAQMTMVLTGADRLLSVLLPMWYKNRSKFQCLSFDAIIIAGYGIYQFVIYYIDYMQSDRTVLLSCSTHEMGRSGVMGPLINVNGMVLSGTLMAIYGLIWITCLLRRKTVNENNKKLIKSLSFIIIMNLVGVFVKTTMSFLFNTVWKVDAFVKNPYAIGMSFLTIAVYSSNAPVLYVVSSKEYRRKFNQQLPWLRRLLNQSNAVQTSIQQHLAATNAANNLQRSQLFFTRTPTSNFHSR